MYYKNKKMGMFISKIKRKNKIHIEKTNSLVEEEKTYVYTQENHIHRICIFQEYKNKKKIRF